MVDFEIFGAAHIKVRRNVYGAQKVSRQTAAGQRLDSIAAKVVRSSLEISAGTVCATPALACATTHGKNSRTPGRPRPAFGVDSCCAGIAIVRLDIATAAEGYDGVAAASA